MPTYEGALTLPTGRFAIVAARFNQLVVDSLVSGCRETLKRHGVAENDIDLAWVPGSFEIPAVARMLAETGGYAAIICLGCVIRGETDHYDHVAGQAAAGIQTVALRSSIPVIFGVLTTETVEQALNRAGLKSGNKGAEAATAAIEMAHLMGQLKAARGGEFGFPGTTT
jgi:6,7-dimethyl-8-ribityllumazine synthase